jgi:uncharacterized protein (DUF58 family)
MLSPEILKQIRRIELHAGHIVTESLAGNYQSAFKGQGMEFDNVREYMPGDDVRTIDWNVTARMSQPFIKVLREERELTLMLMVDVSPSQWVGTTSQFKQEIAAELAAVLAFLATKNNDKVGLIVFSDHVEQYIPPQKGRSHIWGIIRSVMTHEAKGHQTNIGAAVDFMQQVVKRKSLCFLLSDFWAEGYEHSLKMASRRHDLTCVRVGDPIEEEVHSAGLVAFQDAETGEPLIVDTSDKKFRQAYQAAETTRDEALRNLFRKNGINTFRVRTGDSVVTPLMQYMRQREHLRRRK